MSTTAPSRHRANLLTGSRFAEVAADCGRPPDTETFGATHIGHLKRSDCTRVKVVVMRIEAPSKGPCAVRIAPLEPSQPACLCRWRRALSPVARALSTDGLPAPRRALRIRRGPAFAIERPAARLHALPSMSAHNQYYVHFALWGWGLGRQLSKQEIRVNPTATHWTCRLSRKRRWSNESATGDMKADVPGEFRASCASTCRGSNSTQSLDPVLLRSYTPPPIMVKTRPRRTRSHSAY
jgi:hypothetical protein